MPVPEAGIAERPVAARFIASGLLLARTSVRALFVYALPFACK